MDNRQPPFSPAAHPDIPLYNIQAVTAATGVSTITLRSWERRYGVPQPKRDAKGYRLYSERDIVITRWLKDRVEKGVGISRAVHMLRALQTGQLSDTPAQTFDFDSLCERLLAAVKRIDEGRVGQVISEALMVASVEDVALRLLQPVLYQVGELWAQGELSVTSEHIGSNLIRSHLTQLVLISPSPLRSELIVVGSAPGDLHDIGALIVTLFLRRRGFEVLYAGANVEPESLKSDVLNLDAAAVCLSANSVESLNGLRSLYADFTSTYGGIRGFGGRVFNDNESLTSEIKGTFLGRDAAEAVRTLEDLLDAKAQRGTR